jgi:23S rRNA (guanine745-N1)-methyltransferase
MLRCPNRHSFDLAREGYVNLLLRQKKLPETVGDSAEMLQARQEFLARGFYDPLSNRLNERVAEVIANLVEPVVVDVGSGEGFYLARLAAYLQRPDVTFFGLDVAKTAVRLATKRGIGRFVVADVNQKLPFADASVHVLLNIFAPRHTAEFARILAPNGLLLVVIPAPDHLQNLREQFGLLNVQPEKQAHLINQFQNHFSHYQLETLHYDMHLDNHALTTLLQMTPNARHLTADQWQQIQNTTPTQTAASFEILQMIRKR